MREPATILADMRRARTLLAELGREYAGAVFAKQAEAIIRKPHRWHGYALEALRHEYEGTTRTLSNLADRHHTSAGNIVNLAKKYDWVRHELHRQLQPRSAGTPVEHLPAE